MAKRRRSKSKLNLVSVILLTDLPNKGKSRGETFSAHVVHARQLIQEGKAVEYSPENLKKYGPDAIQGPISPAPDPEPKAMPVEGKLDEAPRSETSENEAGEFFRQAFYNVALCGMRFTRRLQTPQGGLVTVVNRGEIATKLNNIIGEMDKGTSMLMNAGSFNPKMLPQEKINTVGPFYVPVTRDDIGFSGNLIVCVGVSEAEAHYHSRWGDIIDLGEEATKDFVIFGPYGQDSFYETSIVFINPALADNPINQHAISSAFNNQALDRVLDFWDIDNVTIGAYGVHPMKNNAMEGYAAEFKVIVAPDLATAVNYERDHFLENRERLMPEVERCYS